MKPLIRKEWEAGLKPLADRCERKYINIYASKENVGARRRETRQQVPPSEGKSWGEGGNVHDGGRTSAERGEDG